MEGRHVTWLLADPLGEEIQEASLLAPVDRRVPAAQDRGRLLPQRGKAGRSVDRLAAKLLEEAEEALRKLAWGPAED